MGKLLQFHQHEDSVATLEFHLSDLLATVGVDLLDKKGSFRCRVCKAVWKGFETDPGPFGRWECPNRCNTE